VDCITPARSGGIEVTDWNTVRADARTLATSRPGVFAAGDVVTGPNTIIEAVAAGKRAAAMISRYLRGAELAVPPRSHLPQTHVPPVEVGSDEARRPRVETPRASVEWRRRNFAEVEVGLSVEEATREARRCLRCDLEFTERDQQAAAKGEEVSA
jgi:NADH-quinone oxidoreductase subunit F